GARQLHAWTKIARREVWAHAVFPEGRTFEDIAVIPALVAGTASYTHVPQPWVGYRQRDDSIMATMTPRKALDLMQSLRELAAGLRALDGLDADARFAIDYFCLRTLASTAGKTNDDTVLDACRQTLRAIFPAGTDDVLRECARRGWVLRRWRLRKGLQRMQGAA
ncbi:MAG: glycosyltransferase family 2 protein, partial [Luteimonas sp.]|nr:glycosyltransferase family 2 protein [Luteimonas sp.]